MDNSNFAIQQPKKHHLLLPLIIFILGIVSLGASIPFLIKSQTPKTADAEYLLKIGSWTEIDPETSEKTSVIWDFTELGKGTLTTNNHQNDYDFTWSLEGETLKIETSWLYDLENEYSYSLDQKSNILTLTSGSKTVKFIPAE